MKKILKILILTLLALALIILIVLFKGYSNYKSNNFKETNLYSTNVAFEERNINSWFMEINSIKKLIDKYNWNISADENLLENNDFNTQIKSHLEYDLETSKILKEYLIQRLFQLIGVY